MVTRWLGVFKQTTPADCTTAVHLCTATDFPHPSLVPVLWGQYNDHPIIVITVIELLAV